MYRQSNVLLWNVVTIAACIGAAVAMYMATSEDIPDNHSQSADRYDQYDETKETESLDYDDIYANQDSIPGPSEKYYTTQTRDQLDKTSSSTKNHIYLSSDFKLDQILNVLDKQDTSLKAIPHLLSDPPIWAQELIQVTKDLTKELSHLKGNTSNDTSSDHISSSEKLDESSKVPTTKSASLEEYLSNVRNAIQKFLNCNRASSSVAEPNKSLSSAVMKCSGALAMYIANLKQISSSSRYSKIVTTNPTFKSSVAITNGYQDILSSVGFVLKGSNYEWDWNTQSLNANQSGTKPPAEYIDPIINECVSLLNQVKVNGLDAVLEVSTENSSEPQKALIPKEGDHQNNSTTKEGSTISSADFVA